MVAAIRVQEHTCNHALQQASHVSHPVLQHALAVLLPTGDVRRTGARLGRC